MKVRHKITLLGLLVASGATTAPTWAETEGNSLILGKEEKWYLKQNEEGKVTAEEPEGEEKSVAVQVHGKVAMTPSATYKEDLWATKNDIKAGLSFKAELAEALCERDATVDVAIALERKEIRFEEAKATVANLGSIGYGSTILAFERANPALLVSPDASVLQLRSDYGFGEQFKIGYAVESALPLKLGLFDRTYTAPAESRTASTTGAGAGEKSRENATSTVNQIDDTEKNETRAFKVLNSIPALGLSLGWQNEEVCVALNGLGRISDYTHSTNPTARRQDLSTQYCFTTGTHLGVQYKVVPKKVTLAFQGCYVAGLGDYIAGLSAIQEDPKRKEMSAVYYTDTQTNVLTPIQAWGAGGTVEFCATKEWVLSVAGSYLTTAEDANRPGSAFGYTWNVLPKLAYNLNKNLTIAVGHAYTKQVAADSAQSVGKENTHKTFGSVGFSF